MEKSRRWLAEATHLCGEIGPEDGVDPRLSAGSYSTKKIKHTAPLAKVARRVISMVLAGEITDPMLNQLEIVEVTMSEDGQFLHVFIHHDPSEQDSWSILSDRLISIQGFLRAQIARMVNRKRIPVLMFKAVQMGR